MNLLIDLNTGFKKYSAVILIKTLLKELDVFLSVVWLYHFWVGLLLVIIPAFPLFIIRHIITALYN